MHTCRSAFQKHPLLHFESMNEATFFFQAAVRYVLHIDINIWFIQSNLRKCLVPLNQLHVMSPSETGCRGTGMRCSCAPSSISQCVCEACFWHFILRCCQMTGIKQFNLYQYFKLRYLIMSNFMTLATKGYPIDKDTA